MAKEPDRRGEREGNRKTIARGMPGDSGVTVVTTCTLFAAAHRRPAFPAPSDWRVEENSSKARADCAARFMGMSGGRHCSASDPSVLCVATWIASSQVLLGRKSLKNGVILPTSSLKLSSKAGRCLIHRSQLAMTAPVARRAIAYGFSMSRPCERRDPSVSAIALIAAARTLVSALEQRPFVTFEARGDEARGDDGVDGPLRHRDVPE